VVHAVNSVTIVWRGRQLSEILPSAKLGCVAYDPTTPPTFRVAAAILVWLDCKMQLFVTILEPKTGDFHAFQA